jgi:hypothetical protein
MSNSVGVTVTKQTALYRLYAADDALFYIGVAALFGVRWHAHARTQPWWPEVHHQTVHWYASREDALLAEKIAIREEAPIFNIQNSPWEKRVKDDGTGFYVVPKPRRVPKLRDPNKEMTLQHFRAPDAMWEAFSNVCAGRGLTSAADLIAHMRRTIRQYGDEADKALLAAAEAELKQRRARKGGRPRKPAAE